MSSYRGRTLVFVTIVVVVALGVVALAVAAIGDTTPPVTTDDYDGLWHSTDVNVMLRATDQASGVAGTYYSWNVPDYVSGTFATLAAERDHTNDGVHTLTYYSEDAVGNREKPKSRVVKIDTRAPVTTVSGQNTLWHRTPVVLTFSADDRGGAGIDVTQYRIDKKAWKNGTSATVRAPKDHSWDGRHTVRFRSRDTAGNVEKAKKVIVKIDTRGVHAVATPVASVASGAYSTWRYLAGGATGSSARTVAPAKSPSGKGEKAGSLPKEAEEVAPSTPGTEAGSDSGTRKRSWRRSTSVRGSTCATDSAAVLRSVRARRSSAATGEPTAAPAPAKPRAKSAPRRACGPSGGPRRARSAAPASARSWSRSAAARVDGASRSTGRRTAVTQRSAHRGDSCTRSNGNARSEARGKRTRSR